MSIARNVWRGKQALDRSNARKMLYGMIGEPGEPALAVYMPGPHSYTGEDIVELHCHGGTVAVRRTMEAVLAQKNVRSAEPGEFTMRAFVNGKLDLAQAEAVGDLISASSDATFNLAVRQLNGVLSQTINNMREKLLYLASDCESRLDFPDEVLDFAPAEALLEQLNSVQDELQKLIDSAHAGIVLREGVRIALCGKPNAGKSSLLNALLGIDRAIVSDIPGTTRDTLAESAVLRNITVEITDTAGLRESGDMIEALGVERARVAMRQAQIVFYLLDSSCANPEKELADFHTNCPSGSCVIVIWNKLDLAGDRVLPEPENVDCVKISTRTGENLDLLLDAFEKAVWQDSDSRADAALAVSARHLELLQSAAEALAEVPPEILSGNWELAAFNLHLALTRTGKIIGETVEPDLLDEIFSRFCIGK